MNLAQRQNAHSVHIAAMDGMLQELEQNGKSYIKTTACFAAPTNDLLLARTLIQGVCSECQ